MPKSLFRPAGRRALFFDKDEPMSTITITKVCPQCKQPHSVTVEQWRFNQWRNGVSIQDAFPTTPKEDREILITGIDNACWQQMFAYLEEEEEDEDGADADADLDDQSPVR